MSDVEITLKNIREIEEEFLLYARKYVKHDDFQQIVNPKAVGTLGASLLIGEAIREKRLIEERVKFLLEGHEAMFLLSSDSSVRRLASESIKRLREE